jgi:hypothetical protein
MKSRYFNAHPIAVSFSNFAKSWLTPSSRVTTARMKQHFDVVAIHNRQTMLNSAFMAHRYMSQCYNLNMF